MESKTLNIVNKKYKKDIKKLRKVLGKDIKKSKGLPKIEQSKLREFAKTCRVTESPNRNYALDYYKERILK